MKQQSQKCPICNHPTYYLGEKLGESDLYKFRRCNFCMFTFIENYRSDFSNIYNEQYYFGKGVDPKVRYAKQFKMGNKSIKYYEYQGIFKIFNKLCTGQRKWLDFGCGLGGLVKYANENGVNAIGYDEGFAYEWAKREGIPIINKIDLDNQLNQFDFISAIEVIEHIPRPLELFNTFKRLLKPNGILFLTTANSRPFKNSILKWYYTDHPDAHISFYEPKTLRFLLNNSGFSCGKLLLNDGYDDIIKYKLLNYLSINKRSRLLNLIPLDIISKYINHRYKFSDQPYGISI